MLLMYPIFFIINKPCLDLLIPHRFLILKRKLIVSDADFGPL